MKNVQVLKEKNVTPTTTDDFASVNQIKEITLFSTDELSQYDLAYDVFKEAKLVSVIDCQPLGTDDDSFIYKVRVVYYSPDEHFDNMAYGEDYNEDYD